MAYIYTFLVLLIIGLICYRLINKKSVPPNRYTPYDEITIGSKIEIKQDILIDDTKHNIKYEEKMNNDKTI
ncbi:DUF3951 domain-containing protein [Bacillus sp. RG28]|uniref:DUF3951 domain-containing protein n=1 Tax=Gottfriedia endophytica TaxID=2820819 RepID=A0A940NR62_9BACI|nr:DUF3951 domain-containing protein [Gottfriedia endophytica]